MDAQPLLTFANMSLNLKLGRKQSKIRQNVPPSYDQVFCATWTRDLKVKTSACIWDQLPPVVGSK